MSGRKVRGQAAAAVQRAGLILDATVQAEALVTLLLRTAEREDDVVSGVLVRLQDLLGVVGAAVEPDNPIEVDALYQRIHGVPPMTAGEVQS